MIERPVLVGDPIDVVRGANVDVQREFTLPGVLPLVWRRHYDSARHTLWCGLGWGHAHEFEHVLQFDLDGMTHVGPLGARVAFAALVRDGDVTLGSGTMLWRIAPDRYHVRRPGKPSLEFVFAPGEVIAPLSALVLGRHRVEFAYAPDGRLAEIHDASGRVVRVEHARDGGVQRLILFADRWAEDGRVLLTYGYNRAGNLVSGVDGYRHAFAFAYDAANRMVRRTDRRGYSVNFVYDETNRCTFSAGEDGLHAVELAYGPDQRITAVREANGGDWQYGYNDAGLVTHIFDPYGGARVFELEGGWLAAEVDPSGNRIGYEYDASGALVGRRDLFGRFAAEGTDHFRDPFHRRYTPRTPIEWVEGGGLAFSTYRLPPADEPTRVPAGVSPFVRRAPEAPVADWSAPRTGPVRVGPPVAPGTEERDLFGVLVRFTDPGGASERWMYDANGNVVQHVDADGGVWTHEYGSWNLCAASYDPLGGVTQRAYSAVEQLTWHADPGGTVTERVYDLRRRLVETRRDGRVVAWRRYNATEGVVERRCEPDRVLATIDVGPGDLPTAVRWADGRDEQFEYDARGRLIRAAVDGVEVVRSYDLLGRMTVDERDGAGVRHRYAGSALAETTVIGQFRVGYARDENGGQHVVDPTGFRHASRYLGHGLFERLRANGRGVVSQYDWAGRCLLRAVFSVDGRGQVDAWRYVYSPAGRLIAATAPRGDQTRYAYDEAQRLTAVVAPDGSAGHYAYDAAGSLYAAPHLRATTGDGNRLAAANGSWLAYDERGRLSRRTGADGVTEYRYDDADRLVEVATPNGPWRAAYDALGRRTAVTWRGEDTRFYWDAERLAAEVRADGATRVYVYPDVDARVPFMFVDYEDRHDDPARGRAYFVTADQLGGPLEIEDAAGRPVWRAAAEPYGLTRVAAGPRVDYALRWPGHYLDAGTGLHYNRHRYYSPELGRYLQPDPIDIDGGANVYAYPASPLDRVDLDGLACPKAMILDPADQAAFDEKQQEAVALAAALRDEMMNADTGRVRTNPDGSTTPITAHDNTTLAVLVVQRDGKYEIVVASSAGLADLPPNVAPLLNDYPVVNPPPRDRGTVPETGDTGMHAEQRGLRAADNAPNVDGVASVTPTRPCCPGCAQAVRDRGDPNLDSVSPIPGLPKER